VFRDELVARPTMISSEARIGDFVGQRAVTDAGTETFQKKIHLSRERNALRP